MLMLWQHPYIEIKDWDLCGLRPHNLLIDCNPVLYTDPTGPHCYTLIMFSDIELSFQASSDDHNFFTRVYTLTHPFKLSIISAHFQLLVRVWSWAHNLLEQLFARLCSFYGNAIIVKLKIGNFVGCNFTIYYLIAILCSPLIQMVHIVRVLLGSLILSNLFKLRLMIKTYLLECII